MTLYARFAAHLDAVLDALEAEGALAPGSTAARWRSSRRAIRRMAISPPMRRWCWPSAPAPIRARWPSDRAQARGARRGGERRGGGAGLHQHPARPLGLGGGASRDPRRGRRLMAARPWARGQRVNVEYVSANPTGPMHMGHCRGAVVGDALASLLEYAGYEVIREYYVNDAGAPGRRPRPLRAPALSGGARPPDRRDPRRPLSRRLSEAGRRGARRRIWRRLCRRARRANGWRSSAGGRSRRCSS